MKRFALLATAFAAFAPVFVAPASAGLRATFTDATKPVPLVIEVADNGDARIAGGEEADGSYGLLLGGHFYIVGKDKGVLKVARIEDVGAAIDQVIPPVFKGMLSGAPSKPGAHFRAVKKGPATTAGRAGTLYAIYGLNDDKPDEATEFVLSDDPALLPVGRAMEQFMNAAIVPMAPLIGAGAAEIVADTHAIYALGTPLDAGRFKLTSVETVTVSPDRLKLPATPETVESLVAEMKSSQGAPPPPEDAPPPGK